jgi:hypothetical protein
MSDERGTGSGASGADAEDRGRDAPGPAGSAERAPDAGEPRDSEPGARAESQPEPQPSPPAGGGSGWPASLPAPVFERPRPRFGEYAEDTRPRPQYGEYASTEEQLASIKDPVARELARPAPPPVVEPAPQPGPQPMSAMSSWDRPSGAQIDRSGAPPLIERQARPLDRVVTMLLLAFGLFQTLVYIPSLLQFGETMKRTFQTLDIAFTNTAQANTMGIVILFVYCALWVAALLLSMFSLRRGRLTFWIPLVAGILAAIIASVLMLVVASGDPAFIAYMNRSTS